MVKVAWLDGMAFVSDTPSGATFTMDSHPDHGGKGLGPTPVETFLAGLAACSAMDVLSILEKKRQDVTSYRVEIDGDRIPPGTWPRPFTEIRIRHIVQGNDLDPIAVARAVELSDQKYCTVLSTIRTSPPVISTWEIEESE